MHARGRQGSMAARMTRRTGSAAQQPLCQRLVFYAHTIYEVNPVEPCAPRMKSSVACAAILDGTSSIRRDLAVVMDASSCRYIQVARVVWGVVAAPTVAMDLLTRIDAKLSRLSALQPLCGSTRRWMNGHRRHQHSMAVQGQRCTS